MAQANRIFWMPCYLPLDLPVLGGCGANACLIWLTTIKAIGGTVEASVTVTFDLGEGTRGQGDKETRRQGDKEAGGQGDKETRRQGDKETRRQGDITETLTSQEWSVTRKLRVTQQGTYTSTYYINGEPCTLTELHEQQNELRIYPEGYNVVLQGDVTSIISMNPRERREIIDELAGVATFDRKITQAKATLDEKDLEDSFRIVERELIAQPRSLVSRSD